jgi:hypothetical protein
MLKTLDEYDELMNAVTVNTQPQSVDQSLAADSRCDPNVNNEYGDRSTFPYRRANVVPALLLKWVPEMAGQLCGRCEPDASSAADNGLASSDTT